MKTDVFDTEKIERFAAAFGQYNRSAKMAVLFNEMMDEIEILMEFAFDKECEADQLARKHAEWINFQVRFRKMKRMTEKMKKELHYVAQN